MLHPAIAPNRVAVITGGASGIGLATAQKFAEKGMRICLADINEDELSAAKKTISTDVITVKTDVSKLEDVTELKNAVLDAFGEVSIVMNNAGVGGRGAGPWTGLDQWQRILDTNLWGVIYGLQTFMPLLIDQEMEQGRPGAVICTGSKQGLTNPPGNSAYNVAKAGIRTALEGVAHELREITDCGVTAHLLIPGWTYTGLTKKQFPEKPAAAWEPEQVADQLLVQMSAGDFYIICPDNDVTVAMDQKRLQWNTDDVIKNRPALSRWHPDFEEEFQQFMNPD
ncbi:MAG: NAD(P)-dependent dehydrogenase (short-subunit alcohol dehydrogenase family) [Candidatus Azotimanducaceae bacterium]|jgi:NAD(P)-dependent dehydrogenase (short-subunit alcohol dehydrogenase family)